MNEIEVESITKQIVENYYKYPVSENQFKCFLPNKTEVIEITNKLIELIFPTYFSKNSVNEDELAQHIGYLLITIKNRLLEQTSLALSKKYYGCDTTGQTMTAEKSQQFCANFFRTIPNIQRIIATDVSAASDGDPAACDKDEIILSYPGVFAVCIHRFAHEMHKLGLPYIPRIMSEYAHEKTGIDIHPGAIIGEFFFIDHGTGVVIGETTIIGDNVKIYQGVTLGALSTRGGKYLKGNKRHPTIENNVTIYSGASVLGGETIIGKDVVLGGNVFITKSVPSGTTAYMKTPEINVKPIVTI